jgi:hypothetical protein
LKHKEVKEFFRTTYDGLLHQDHVPVDEFGEPVEGEFVRLVVPVPAEMHETKIDGEPDLKVRVEAHQQQIDTHLRELAEGG